MGLYPCFGGRMVGGSGMVSYDKQTVHIRQMAQQAWPDNLFQGRRWKVPEGLECAGASARG